MLPSVDLGLKGAPDSRIFVLLVEVYLYFLLAFLVQQAKSILHWQKAQVGGLSNCPASLGDSGRKCVHLLIRFAFGLAFELQNCVLASGWQRAQQIQS